MNSLKKKLRMTIYFREYLLKSSYLINPHLMWSKEIKCELDSQILLLK